ncbi:hypothetical protein LJR168_003770 [Pseudoxanthomonas sp. LjRoot168]|uniref:hypothetical protein n=1 Tax=unclassified Pseudoxanthomonas TaxID=2645906 RepID=UPI003ECCDA7B
MAGLAMHRLIAQIPSPDHDPAIEPMRAVARAADRLAVLIESDNEDHKGAAPDDIAAYDALMGVLARWQITYGDSSMDTPKKAADAMALAMNHAIARVEIAHQEGSDIMKALLPQMKDAVAVYYRTRIDFDMGMLRSPTKTERFDGSFVVEMARELRHLVGGLFKHPGHVMTSDADRTLAERMLAKLDRFLKGPKEPAGDIEPVKDCLNAFETVLLHNKPMSANDLAARKALLADADDAVVRLEGALAAAQRRAAFFENELREASHDLFMWDGTTESIQTIRENITICLAGGTNKAFGQAGAVKDGPSNAKASEGLQLMKGAIADMDGVEMGELRSDFGGGWIGSIRMADGTQVLANYSAHGRIDLGIEPATGPFPVEIVRQVDLAQMPSAEDLRSHLQATADILAAARAPQAKLLAHAAITHDTLSELAENGDLPSAIQARVADHLEEGTALFRAAGIESEPAPITADSLRM